MRKLCGTTATKSSDSAPSLFQHHSDFQASSAARPGKPSTRSASEICPEHLVEAQLNLCSSDGSEQNFLLGQLLHIAADKFVPDGLGFGGKVEKYPDFIGKIRCE